MSVLRVDGLLADWSPIGVTDFASCLVSFSCGRDCLLGKTLQHRFLNITAFPERHQSARRFPSIREMAANGVTTESPHIRDGTAPVPPRQQEQRPLERVLFSGSRLLMREFRGPPHIYTPRYRGCRNEGYAINTQGYVA
jgi:hypothetical protein